METGDSTKLTNILKTVSQFKGFKNHIFPSDVMTTMDYLFIQATPEWVYKVYTIHKIRWDEYVLSFCLRVTGVCKD